MILKRTGVISGDATYFLTDRREGPEVRIPMSYFTDFGLDVPDYVTLTAGTNLEDGPPEPPAVENPGKVSW